MASHCQGTQLGLGDSEGENQGRMTLTSLPSLSGAQVELPSAYPTESQRAREVIGAQGCSWTERRVKKCVWGSESSGTNGSYMTNELWGEKELVNKTNKYKQDGAVLERKKEIKTVPYLEGIQGPAVFRLLICSNLSNLIKE